MTRQNNPYRDDFVVDTIDLKKIVEDLVGLEEIPASQELGIVEDQEKEWIDDRSKLEVEFDDEQHTSYEQEVTNLRVVEWLNEMTSYPNGISMEVNVRGVLVEITHIAKLSIKN